MVYVQEGGQCGRNELGEGLSDRRIQRKQGQIREDLEDIVRILVFFFEMRICQKFLSKGMICFDICFERIISFIVLYILGVKDRSRDYLIKIC